MGALSLILRDTSDGRLLFWCPGCDGAHGVRVGEGSGPCWGWNGSVDKPTFTPSILVRNGHHVAGHKGDCWCSFNKKATARGEEPSGFKCMVCHSFVTDGRIQFLSDCTHALAGQTVDIPDFES